MVVAILNSLLLCSMRNSFSVYICLSEHVLENHHPCEQNVHFTEVRFLPFTEHASLNL